MQQVLLRRGAAAVEEVPEPLVEPGTVTVRVRSSCISIGTEMSGLTTSGLPLWRRALAQPDQARKVVSTVATLGVGRTWNLVSGRLAAGAATGYSAAGVVEQVGPGVTDLKPGDRVACAGAQFAHHAEVIRVPRNLTVPVPDALSLEHASTVTLGAIALQGVRRAAPTLGETFVVIGLGVLGQLTVQLLRANGCRVLATDPDRERIALASQLGAAAGLHPEDGNPVDDVVRHTGGIGADGVIITAATASDQVVSQAFRMCRKKGRVVLVGDVGLHLRRGDFYQKEIDFFISSSYGPGRYDENYEERGLDYPIGYVRWTENRNMAEYLRLAAAGQVQLAPLVSAVHPVAQAAAAYASLQQDARRPLMVLLSYPEAPDAAPVRRVWNTTALEPRSGAAAVALVGAGGFAKGMHLPNLQTLRSRLHLRAVVSRTGHNAAATARQWGAEYATTDYAQVLGDPAIDAVVIATPHQLHASMALQALEAGKHVLVEKPLALEREELARLDAWLTARGDARTPVLMTGFNRRFSPYLRRIREITAGRSNPLIVNYRMNAGYIPLDHSLHREQGGRNRGEACHIYDLFTFLTGARVTRVTAHAVRPATAHYSPQDNFVATATFEDGSVATLTYTAMGAAAHPKESMEVFVDGRVIALEDYRRLTVAGGRGDLRTRLPQKGQLEELAAFGEAVAGGTGWPIAWWEQMQATTIALTVEEQLAAVR